MILAVPSASVQPCLHSGPCEPQDLGCPVAQQLKPRADFGSITAETLLDGGPPKVLIPGPSVQYRRHVSRGCYAPRTRGACQFHSGASLSLGTSRQYHSRGMTHEVTIPSAVAESAFREALRASRSLRGSFFHEVREALRRELAACFCNQGVRAFPERSLSNANYCREAKLVPYEPILKYTGTTNDSRHELDLEFCIRYGHDDYSLQAINYIDRTYCHLPALLSFARMEPFSVGNIAVLLDNADYEIDVSFEAGCHVAGYGYSVSPRKKKSYVCFFGMWFERSAIGEVLELANRDKCAHDVDDLDEVMIGTISYPILYICRLCGQLFTCTCFEGLFSVDQDIVRLLPYGNSEAGLRDHVRQLRRRAELCHLCTGAIPAFTYGSSMYYSAFLQKYLPYHVLLSRKQLGHTAYEGEDFNRIENELREMLGYPRIGEKWISETMLFKIVAALFSPRRVIQHYRGPELGGLEIDIWIPDLRVGIEYQGVQHFEAVDHWGGEDGFLRRLEHDRRKKAICRTIGYALIEFRYEEELTEQTVKEKLRRFISEDSGGMG